MIVHAIRQSRNGDRFSSSMLLVDFKLLGLGFQVSSCRNHALVAVLWAWRLAKTPGDLEPFD